MPEDEPCRAVVQIMGERRNVITYADSSPIQNSVPDFESSLPLSDQSI
jgi:hypothetical protein